MSDLTDADLDHMHHALGRPTAEQVDTYRNYYCCSTNSDDADRFEETGCWDFGRFINDGRDVIYHVNGLGQQKVREWLRARALSTGDAGTAGKRDV